MLMKKKASIIVSALCMGAMASMQLNVITDAINEGARCLDGSAPAYYFKEGTTETGKKNWVLFVQGGGWCYKETDCYERSNNDRGSSDLMPTEISDGGPLDESSETNPDFYDWNHVVLAYCDGSSFTSDREDPVPVKDKLIYFRGYRNLKAIINDLIKNKGMNVAEQVMLVGCSAGGLSSYEHADQIREMLPNSVTRFKVAPFSGVFLNTANVEGKNVYPDQMKYVYNMMNASAGANEACLYSKQPEDRWKCMFAEEVIEHVKTPLMVMNSAYDSWSSFCIFTSEYVDESSSKNGNCTAAPGWYDCIKSGDCTDEQIDIYNTKWGDKFRQVIASNPGTHRDGNGAFVYSCHQHCAESNYNWWNRITLGNTTMRGAFTKWYFSDNEAASLHTYGDCTYTDGFYCNPTCAAASKNDLKSIDGYFKKIAGWWN